MLGGQINVVLTLDNGQFTIATQKSGQTIQQLKSSIEQTSRSTAALEEHFTGLGGRFRAVVQTASMLRYAMHDVHDIFMALPGAILKTSGEIEKLTKLMEGMSKETTKAARQAEAMSNVKFVFNMAQNAPFEVKALTDSFVKLKSGGIDPTNGSMMALVNSVAKFGGTTETLHRASIAIQQMSGKGVISMEELRQQLGEAVPNAINLMAEGAGQSVEVFAKKVSDGTVQASMALQNMFTVMTIENAGAAAEMMDSWTGMLSLLKTKFELFKNDAGQAGFFKASKDALQEIIDMFDSMGAKSLSFEIGRGLGDAVVAVRQLIDFFNEWGGTIKTVGELFLLYYGSQRLMQLGAGIKSFADARMAAYRQEVAAARDAARAASDAMRDQASNMRAKAQMEESHAARSTQLAGQLYAEQARYSNQIAELEKRNLGWAGQQKIDRLTARRDETRAAIVEIQTEAVARRQQADEMRKVADAHERMAEATRAGTTASRQDIAVVAQANLERQKATDLLNQKATAAMTVGNNIGFMSRAMMGVSTVVNAFGGWINIAIMALGYLVVKLREAMNYADLVKETMDRINAGIATKQDEERLKQQTDANEQKIRNLENFLKNNTRVSDEQINRVAAAGAKKTADQLRAQQANWDKSNADLKAALDERAALAAKAADVIRIKTTSESDNAVSFERRQLEADTNARFREATDRINVIRKQIADEKAKLVADANAAGKEVSPEALAKVSAAGLKEITNIQMTVISESLANLRKIEADTVTALKSVDASSDQGKRLTARLKALTNERDGLIQQAETLAQKSLTLGKSSNVGKSEKPKKPLTASQKEDPLVRMIEDLEASVEIAKAKLTATAANARDVQALRNEVAMSVLGDMASGKFDSTDVDETGKKRVTNFVGGKDERKDYVQNFAQALKEGKTDIEAYIRSLTALSETDKQRVLQAFQLKASQAQLSESQKALTSAQAEERKTLEDLNAARTAYASDGLAKESAGMVALEKKFADLRATLKAGTDDFAAFDKAKAAAFANQATTDALSFGTDAKKALRAATLEQVKSTQTVAEARKYEFDENIKRIDEEAAQNEAAIQKAIKLNENDVARKKQLEEELTRVKQNATQARLAAEINYANKSRTAMDELARNWRDSTSQMNQMTANWASGFMDRLIDVVAGGSFKWKDFVAGMAKDLLSVTMKKGFGDLVTSSFGSIGASLGSMLGLTDSKSADAKGTLANPMITKDYAAATGADQFKEVKEKLNSTWDVLKENLSNVWTSLKDNMSRLMEGLSTGLDWLMKTISSAFSGSSGSGFGGFLGALFSGGESAGAGAPAAGDVMMAGDFAMVAAKGGLMTQFGPASLKKYANGGIATSPQVALFGEGSMNEAYVPLPDGRSIPVTMTGGNSTTNTQNGVVINIVVNKDGSESSASQGDDAQSWNRVAQRVRGVVMEEMVNQQRPGGLLYK